MIHPKKEWVVNGFRRWKRMMMSLWSASWLACLRWLWIKNPGFLLLRLWALFWNLLPFALFCLLLLLGIGLLKNWMSKIPFFLSYRRRYIWSNLLALLILLFLHIFEEGRHLIDERRSASVCYLWFQRSSAGLLSPFLVLICSVLVWLLVPLRLLSFFEPCEMKSRSKIWTIESP